MEKLKKIIDKKGISPVIGVILLVAVAVALVSLATVLVFDIGSDVSEPETDATLSTSGTSVIYVRGSSELQLRNQDDEIVDTLSSSGDTVNIPAGGKYQVIAVQNDGSEQLIDTVSLPEPSERVQSEFTLTDNEEEETTLRTTDDIEFDASESISFDGDVESYIWNFGDRTVIDTEDETVTHSYDEPGEYTVVLTVEDEEGQSNTAEETITIEADEPTASASVDPEEGTVNDEFEFDASDSESPNGEIESYEWDFGDGSDTFEGNIVNHEYDETGEYTVALTITDSAGESNSDTVTVTVDSEVNSDANVEEEEKNVDEEFKFEFDGSDSTADGTEIESYAWDFGDGNMATGEEVNHEYSEAGEYNVELTVTGEDGTSDTDTLTVTAISEVNANANVDEEEKNVDEEFTFNGSDSTVDGSTISSYEWDFDDGNMATGEEVNHEYSEAGEYNVELTVEDNSGNTDSDIVTITVFEQTSGTVEYNPPVEGVTVSTVDEDGEEIDSTVTNSNGEYTVKRLDSIKVNGNDVNPDENGLIDLNDVEGESVPSVLMDGDGSADNPYKIEFASDLQAMNENLGADYELVNDIDASETVNWNVLQSGTEMTEEKFTFGGFDKGEQIELPYHIQEIKSVVDTNTGEDVNIIIISNEDGIIEIDTESEPEDIKITYTIEEHVLGFKPIGNEDNAFTGTLDGQGYEIDGLTIDRPDEDNIGLLGNTGDSSEIENIGMVNYNIHGNSDVGGLVGTNNGEIYNTYIELIEDNTMSSDNPRMGGLVGNNNGIISTSYSIIQGEIKSSGLYIGGFVGLNQIEGTISNSYSITEGTISGSSQTSGFLGFNNANFSGDEGTVENSYYNGADDENIPSGKDNSVQLIKEDMLGDNYDNEFETDIVNNNSFIGITNDYPILEWQNNE